MFPKRKIPLIELKRLKLNLRGELDGLAAIINECNKILNQSEDFPTIFQETKKFYQQSERLIKLGGQIITTMEEFESSNNWRGDDEKDEEIIREKIHLYRALKILIENCVGVKKLLSRFLV